MKGTPDHLEAFRHIRTPRRSALQDCLPPKRSQKHFFHHRTGTNEAVLSKGYTADDSGIGSDGSTLLDQSGAYLIHFADLRTRIVHIGKNRGRPTEDPVLKDNTLVNAYVVLNLAPIAYGHVSVSQLPPALPEVADFMSQKFYNLL